MTKKKGNCWIANCILACKCSDILKATTEKEIGRCSRLCWEEATILSKWWEERVSCSDLLTIVETPNFIEKQWDYFHLSEPFAIISNFEHFFDFFLLLGNIFSNSLYLFFSACREFFTVFLHVFDWKVFFHVVFLISRRLLLLQKWTLIWLLFSITIYLSVFSIFAPMPWRLMQQW